MTSTTKLKLALAVAGILVWLYGTAYAAPLFQYVGIGLLVVAVVLRFIRPRA